MFPFLHPSYTLVYNFSLKFKRKHTQNSRDKVGFYLYCEINFSLPPCIYKSLISKVKEKECLQRWNLCEVISLRLPVSGGLSVRLGYASSAASCSHSGFIFVYTTCLNLVSGGMRYILAFSPYPQCWRFVWMLQQRVLSLWSSTSPPLLLTHVALNFLPFHVNISMSLL